MVPLATLLPLGDTNTGTNDHKFMLQLISIVIDLWNTVVPQVTPMAHMTLMQTPMTPYDQKVMLYLISIVLT